MSWLPPPSNSAFVQTIVTDGIDVNQSKSEQAVSTVTALIDSMQGLLTSIGAIPQIVTELGNVTATVDAYVRPTPPVRPSIDTTFASPGALAPVLPNFQPIGSLQAINPQFAPPPARATITAHFPGAPQTLATQPNFPAAPADVSLGSVSELVIDAVPQLSAAEPQLNTITAPAKFTKAAPTLATLPDRQYPDKPSQQLPAAPGLRTLTLPAAPTLLDIGFTGILPTPLDLPPDVDFTFTERDYQSLLVNELQDRLLSLVLNTAQTGLNPAIEQQIWDRARERTAALTKGLVDSITRQFARSGWTLPSGDQAERVLQAMETGVEADITESRSIATAQADLEQKNFQFAFTQALTLEGALLNYHNNVEQRAFESAKYVIEAAINLYQIKAAYFNAGVTLYTAQSQVYRDRLQAELAKLELYKAQLEGQKLIGELNRQDLDNYRAQIDAVIAIYGLYKDELEAVKTQLEGDGLKVQAFEATVRAFAEELHAKSLEYDGYKAELSAEEIKAKHYETLVNAFGKRIDAFASVNDARVKKLDADVKINLEVPLQIAEQQIKLFAAKVDSEAQRLQSSNGLNETLAKLYATSVTAEEARVKSEALVYGTDVDAYKATNEGEASRLEALNATNKTITEEHQIRTEAESKRLQALTDNNNSQAEIYKTTVQAKTAQIGALTDLYKGDAQVFGTLVDSEGTRVNAQVNIQKQQIDYLVQRANVMIEAMKANIATFLSQKELVLGTLKTITQVQAQLAASFGSAINYSAGISASGNESFSNANTSSMSQSSSDSRSDVTTHSD